MKRQKEFVSSDQSKIEAELLRLMRNPKCYAISTIELMRGRYVWSRVRLIERVGEAHWKSWWDYRRSGFRMSLSCFSKRPKSAEHIASQAANCSRHEHTLIVGWFA